MAKKGGVQQLQTEVNTNEDFEKFMDRDGLLVLDVYTEWCGPCVGMIGCLKKVKLELGGDNLHLAVCKADTIEYLKRFRDKSEPTWLIGSHGKIVNSMFGTNVPALVQLLTDELELEAKYRKGEATRTFYEWMQLTEIEQAIEDERVAFEEEQLRIEREAALNEREARILFVTDQITEKLNDCGVTLIFPNYAKQRDIHKILVDPAEKIGIGLKDKRLIQIKEADLGILHFECDNPIHPEVMKKLLCFNQDVHGFMWKLGENETRPITEVLGGFVSKMTMSQPIFDENGDVDPDNRIPPILKPFQFNIDNPDPSLLIPDEEQPEPETSIDTESSSRKENSEENMTPIETEESKTSDVAAGPPHDEPSPQTENAVAKETDENKPKTDETEKDGSISSSQATKEDGSKIIPPSRVQSDIVSGIRVEMVNGKYLASTPPMWAAANQRANAALIYLYFRHTTDHFLPPDPVPEPPHVAMVFDAVKLKDIFAMVDLNKDNVLASGYFTHQEPTKAQLIAKNTDQYHKKRKPLIEDKLVLKVAKKTSNTILNFMSLGPCYVSINSEEGRADCEIFFPKGYNVVEEEEDLGDGASVGGKRGKRRRKRKKDSDGSVVSAAVEVPGEEGDEEDGDEVSEQASDLGVTPSSTTQ